MKNGMDRREFLKYSVTAAAVVTSGVGLVGRVMAQEKIDITEVDRLKVWVLSDNYYDALSPDPKIGKRYRAAAGKSIHAEHGLAFYVETAVGGKAYTGMFDYGLDPAGVINNIDLLGLDLGKVNAFGLSHGHYDHYTAAAPILKRYQSRIAGGTPFYAGEEAFAHRFARIKESTELRDIGRFKREEIEAQGLKVVEVKNPTEIIPGAYFTGRIERKTAYEKGMRNALVMRNGKLEHDDFRGEQALFFKVRGKGLVVLSGCAHAGIVNTVLHARKVARTDRVHAVLGGFHLANAEPGIIRNTVADIKAMKPDYIIPAHCTGFEATVAFSRELPDQFIHNTAGVLYTFGT